MDCLLIGIGLVIFAYFDHVRPSSQVTVVATPTPTATLAPTASPTPYVEMAVATATPEPTATPIPEGVFEFEDVFTDGEVIETQTSYKSANVSVTLSNTVCVSPNKQSFFFLDIYVRNIECLRRAFANDTYGQGITEKFIDMSQRVNAICSINGDYYGFGNRKSGLVIANGVLYRDNFCKNEDVCVLFYDGTLKTYKYGSCSLDPQELINEGAWQAFSFGPALLDENGELFETYPQTETDPRTAIGMIEPGHYILAVFDGRRDDTYAKGLTYKGVAQQMKQLGCVAAFNLDGGGSSQMSFLGSVANSPYKSGRPVSDIVYVCNIE